MDDVFEQKLSEIAFYKADDMKFQSLDDIIDYKKLKYLSKGSFARVYKIKDQNWVIKEAKWDVDLHVLKNLHLPLPQQTETILNMLFEVNFFPTEKELKKQFKEYLVFAEYLGYFEKDSIICKSNKQLHNKQENIRKNLHKEIKKLDNKFNLNLSENKVIKDLLDSFTLYHNFLPKEYATFSKSISKKNKGKNTGIIFQEFIEGKTFHDFSEKEMTNELRMQTVLMCILILLMKLETGLVPDLRPKSTLIELYDWFFKTENIIVSKNGSGLKFIDTRWFWDTKSNLVKRGLIIPDLVILSTKFYLNYFLDLKIL